jgi:hypothetical protein
MDKSKRVDTTERRLQIEDIAGSQAGAGIRSACTVMLARAVVRMQPDQRAPIRTWYVACTGLAREPVSGAG